MNTDLESLQQRQLLAYARDLSEIYEHEKARREQLEIANEKLQATIGGVSEGIVAVDGELNIIEANTAFLKLADCVNASFVGKSLKTYLPENRWGDLYQDLFTLSRVDEVKLSPDDRRFYRVQRNPIKGGQKEASGVVFFFVDETWEKRNKGLKDEFITLVSHEIRTPLAIITGFAPFLKNSFSENMNDEERDYFDIIQRTSDRLIRTVTELLDASEDFGAMLREAETFDLHEALDSALQAPYLKGKLGNRHIEYRIGSFSPRIYGYRDLCIKALGHLLENAAEFSPEDSIIIVRTSYANRQFSVEIEDQGEGIALEEIDRVFERFYQVEDHQSRRHEGLGMGLSIVKKVALLHHGNITLSSKPGEGTTAVFSVPSYDEKESLDYQAELNELKEQAAFFKEQSKIYARDLADMYDSSREAESHREGVLVSPDRSENVDAALEPMSAELQILFAAMQSRLMTLLEKEDDLGPDATLAIQEISSTCDEADRLVKSMADC